MTITASLIDGIDHLEPLPVTASRLVAVLADENATMGDAAEIIEQDQALTANILRAANSAIYARRFETRKLRDAATRLGTVQLLNIALAGHLKALSCDAQMYELSEDELWLHAALSADAARLLIANCPGAGIPQSAVVAALMHDIGKLIMVRYLDVNPQDIVAACAREEVSWQDGERLLLGCDHAEVGGAVAKHWSFPSEISRAIECHHQNPIEDPDPLLDAVVVANLVAKTAGVGLGAEGMNMDIDHEAARRLGLTLDTFSRIAATAALNLEDLKELYGS